MNWSLVLSRITDLYDAFTPHSNIARRLPFRVQPTHLQQDLLEIIEAFLVDQTHHQVKYNYANVWSLRKSKSFHSNFLYRVWPSPSSLASLSTTTWELAMFQPPYSLKTSSIARDGTVCNNSKTWTLITSSITIRDAGLLIPSAVLMLDPRDLGSILKNPKRFSISSTEMQELINMLLQMDGEASDDALIANKEDNI